MSNRLEHVMFGLIDSKVDRTPTNEHMANYLAMELLKAQRLSNDIAYQQLRALRVLAKLDSPQDERLFAALNERLD
jgi:hypothetical protein